MLQVPNGLLQGIQALFAFRVFPVVHEPAIRIRVSQDQFWT